MLELSSEDPGIRKKLQNHYHFENTFVILIDSCMTFWTVDFYFTFDNLDNKISTYEIAV